MTLYLNNVFPKDYEIPSPNQNYNVSVQAISCVTNQFDKAH